MTKYESEMDAAREAAREESERAMEAQAEEMSEYPPIVVRFLKRPGAVLYGSFCYSTDDSALLVELRRRKLDGHLLVEMDNWPEKPGVWYVCSEPIREFGTWGTSEYGLPDSPYPSMEKAS